MLRRWPIITVATALFTGLLQAAAPSALAATGTTTAAVNVYSGPGDSNASLGTLGPSTTVSFTCFVAGESVTGQYGTEDIWDALATGGYVPDALVYTGSNSAVVPACPSAQFGTGHYPVAWTGGSGAQPYSGTSTSTSADGAVLPDGQVVTVTCETSGETLTDDKGFVSDLWDQLSSGAYIPNVYIDTQVNGPTPGLSACAPSGSATGGSGSGGGNNGQGGPGTPAQSASTAPASSGGTPVPHDTRPTSGLTPPTFAYPICKSPQADNGSCFLPKQPKPNAATELAYQSDSVEIATLLGFCASVGFTNCVQEGDHYLSATGTQVDISVAALYSGLPGFQGLFQYWLQQNVGNAIQALQNTPVNGSKTYQWDTAGTTNNWTVFDAKSASNDWTWTLHKFSVRMAGDVWIGPIDQSGDRPLQIRYRSFMADIYNFGQAFSNLEDLAKAGMAADFLEKGASDIIVINTTLKSFNLNTLEAHA